jgi:hypothetical protein
MWQTGCETLSDLGFGRYRSPEQGTLLKVFTNGNGL